MFVLGLNLGWVVNVKLGSCLLKVCRFKVLRVFGFNVYGGVFFLRVSSLLLKWMMLVLVVVWILNFIVLVYLLWYFFNRVCLVLCFCFSFLVWIYFCLKEILLFLIWKVLMELFLLNYYGGWWVFWFWVKYGVFIGLFWMKGGSWGFGMIW